MDLFSSRISPYSSHFCRRQGYLVSSAYLGLFWSVLGLPELTRSPLSAARALTAMAFTDANADLQQHRCFSLDRALGLDQRPLSRPYMSHSCPFLQRP